MALINLDLIVGSLVSHDTASLAGYQVSVVLSRVPFYLASALSTAVFMKVVSRQTTVRAVMGSTLATLLGSVVPVAVTVATLPPSLAQLFLPHSYPAAVESFLPYTAPAGAVAALPGTTTVDVCAAPGGKATAIAAAHSDQMVVAGDVHAAKPPPSSEHWNVAPAPASGVRKLNVALVLAVEPDGPSTIWVSGVRVSTDHA